MLLKILLKLIILLISANFALGQSGESQNLIRLQYKATKSLAGKWGLMLDVQHRRIEFLSNTSQHLVRPGITYRLGDNFEVISGHHSQTGLHAGIYTGWQLKIYRKSECSKTRN